MVFDAIIIGAGLGGLCCAAALSKEGFNVCLLEQAPSPGGLLCSFSKEGSILDVGIHYVGWLYPGQPTARYLSYLGIYDHLSMASFPVEAFDIVHLPGGQTVNHPIGLNHFCHTLSEQYPAHAFSLRRYTQMLRLISSFFSEEQLRLGRLMNRDHAYLGVNYWQWLTECIQSDVLTSALSAPLSLCTGGNQAIGLYDLGVLHASNIEGAHRFVGGTQLIVDAFVRRIRDNGALIRCNAHVESICFDRLVRATGVKLRNGELIEAKRVISCIHPWQALAMLESGMQHIPVPERPLQPKTVRRFMMLNNSSGLFGIWLAVERRAIPESFSYSNHYFYQDSPWFSTDEWTLENALNRIPVGVLWQVPAAGASDAVAFVTAPLPWSVWASWADSNPSRRPSEYLALKQRLQNQLLQLFCNAFPNFSDHVRVRCAATPLSFYRYTLRPQGTAYGLMRDYLKPSVDTILRVRPIPNFYMAQGLGVTGFLGITISALNTCAQILGEAHLAHQILRA